SERIKKREPMLCSFGKSRVRERFEGAFSLPGIFGIAPAGGRMHANRRTKTKSNKQENLSI
ncbi:hypothetical protein, partial [Rhizobium phaseoli]|uniref:hypothetical protein n=1 Tax=Rhizobium phaseoli TaxID=396 RepID=UPI001AEE8518